MRSKAAVVVLALALAVVGANLGCGKQLPTQAETERLTSADKLDQQGSVTVFRVAGATDRVAVRFAKVATWSPGSRSMVLLSIEQAETRLTETAPAKLVTLWRYYPASRTFDRALQNEMPSERQFRAAMQPGPRPASDSTVTDGEDPPPPDPEPVVACGCRCSCCATWGCIKCCYR